jgi:hypothetical protein
MGTAELNKALAKLQGQLPHIAKGEVAEVKHKDTGKVLYTYNYADLHGVSAAVLPLMSELGLAFAARPTINEAGQFVLAYSLLHESGESLDGEYLLPDPARFKQQDIGGVITYARRYCLCAVTGVAPAEDDDDAQAASKAKPAPRQQRPQRPPSRPTADPVHAKTTGADHERLRYGTEEATPDDRPAARTRGPIPDGEDQWAGQPAGELPNRVNGTVGAIQQHFKRLGITDRDVRLGYTAQLAQVNGLTSTNDLSKEDAQRVVFRLGKCRDEKALRVLLDHGDVTHE